MKLLQRLDERSDISRLDDNGLVSVDSTRVDEDSVASNDKGANAILPGTNFNFRILLFRMNQFHEKKTPARLR